MSDSMETGWSAKALGAAIAPAPAAMMAAEAATMSEDRIDFIARSFG
tara:strand:+ start:2144 stop:2284 length:141 start_codon:yes stop_codon:yes gene_type:complete